MKNNDLIISKAQEFFNELKPDHLNVYVDDIINLLKERLDQGEKSYGRQVPITQSDLTEWTKIHKKDRDNIQESIEEILDACVYCLAEYLSDESDDYSRSQKEMSKLKNRYMLVVLDNIIYTTFCLFKAAELKRKVNEM